MTDEEERTGYASEFRQKAEAIARERIGRTPEDISALSPEEIRKRLHELRVRQIELEMQNEWLRAALSGAEAGRARYFDLYDLAPVGCCTLSEQGLILEANLTFAKMLGAARSTLIKRSISCFILREDQDVHYLYRKKLLETGEPQECELRLVKPDGELFWAQLTGAVAQVEDGTSGYRVAISNITARRKQSEHMLRLQAEELTATKEKVEDEKLLLATVMDALPVGVSIINRDGGIVQVNKIFENIWGGRRLPETRSVRDYANYRAWWDSTGKPVAPEEWASAIAIQKGESTIGQIFRIERFDETEAFVINSAAPVFNAQGSIVGCAVAVQDITELKWAEQSLLENKKDFARAQEVGGIGSWRLNTRINVLTWSDENYRIFGIPVGTQLNYETFLSCIHPDDLAFVEKKWQEGLSGAPYDIEHRIIADGRIKWVREKAYLEFDKHGAMVGGFGITQDITERKQAEQALRESEALYRAIGESIDYGVWVCAPDGRNTYASESFLRMVGITQEQCSNFGWGNVLHPDDADRTISAWQECVRTNGTWDIEHRFLGVDGGWHPVLARGVPVRNEQNEVICWAGINLDISRLKQTEEELREKEARLRLAQESANIGIWDWMVESGTLDFTPELNMLYGLPRGTIKTYQDWRDLVYPDDISRIEAGRDQAIANREPFELEFRGRHSSGEYRWISTKGGAIYNEAGEAVRVFGVNIDITERKQAEQEKAKLEAMNRRLQKFESMGRMAGAVAHHFNNKLHVVLGYLELTRKRQLPGDPSVSNLTRAIQAADQAAEISRMMLTYLGQVTGRQEYVYLDEICRKSLLDIQASIPENVGVQTEFDPPGPVIRADAKQIKQILINLITNAWEAMGEDQSCTIRLTIKTVSAADISPEHRYPVNWRPEGTSYACLEVQDNGCGIPEEDFEELFFPFFTTKFTGRGLGLPMTLGLLQAHGGAITVESSPGHGSVFRVFFPMTKDEAVPQPQEEAKAAATDNGGTVLLVDDDLIVLQVTTAMLSRLGFAVLSAMDGIDAVEVYRQHKEEIRLVLSDVAMPRMNGWETLLALRQITPNVPVILASGYSEEQVMEGVHHEHPQAFLAKPYGFDVLRDAIHGALKDGRECGDRKA